MYLVRGTEPGAGASLFRRQPRKTADEMKLSIRDSSAIIIKNTKAVAAKFETEVKACTGREGQGNAARGPQRGQVTKPIDELSLHLCDRVKRRLRRDCGPNRGGDRSWVRSPCVQLGDWQAALGSDLQSLFETADEGICSKRLDEQADSATGYR